jgi:5-methyltetrahydropteroyltriglutamate--homocysteine methyltransferase
MKRSTDRILTTHVGSLPRPDDLFEMMLARMDGKPVDETGFAQRVRKAVSDSVREQAAVGLDVVSDGEMGKSSFITYAAQRLEGLEKREGTRPSPFSNTRETKDFPDYYQSALAEQVSARRRRSLVVCTGPIKYKGHAQINAELVTLKSALDGVKATEAFVPAIAPSNVETTTPNEYYPSAEAYVFAIAEAMREEYKAIVDAGFLLQIDDPFLVTYYIMRPDLGIAECRKWAELRVEALNAALAGIPEDRIRFHTCYSVNMGPRIHDMQLNDIIDIILKVRAGGYSFEAANPRHEHEWGDWRRGQAAGRQGADPGRDHPIDCSGGTSRIGCASDWAICRRRWPGAGHRQRGLRVRVVRRIERGASVDRLGEVRRTGRGLAHR